jgi:hypothetical protein
MPLLFTYGTLQDEDVQRSTFGRRLTGEPDQLVGFERTLIRIEDPDFVAASGMEEHAIIRYTGRFESRVDGTVYEVTESDLEAADRYEPAGFERVPAVLASGKRAWVYAASGPRRP